MKRRAGTITPAERLRLERQAARARIRRHGAHALALVREVCAGIGTPEARELACAFRRALRGMVSYSAGVELRPRRRVRVESRRDALWVAGGHAMGVAHEVVRALPLLCAPELVAQATAVRGSHVVAAERALVALRALCEAAGDHHVPPPEAQPALPAVDVSRVTRRACGPTDLRAFDRENREGRGDG